MTLCVESYIGAKDGTEGVKFEEQVLVTESGAELLSRFPFDEALLAREI
jgi:Xaa-Pro aminopeptidase